jgi:hypothetical protein
MEKRSGMATDLTQMTGAQAIAELKRQKQARALEAPTEGEKLMEAAAIRVNVARRAREQ